MNTSLRARSQKIFSFFTGVAACALLLSACAKKPSAAIIGKWRVERDGSIVEFHQDGTMSKSQQGQTLSGTYKFTDDSHLTASLVIPISAEAKAKLPPGAPDSVTMDADCTVKISGADMDMDTIMMVVNDANNAKQTDHIHFKRVP